jgi:hypothetical protein
VDGDFCCDRTCIILATLNEHTEAICFLSLKPTASMRTFPCRQMILSHRFDFSEPRNTYWTAHPAALDSFDSQQYQNLELIA